MEPNGVASNRLNLSEIGPRIRRIDAKMNKPLRIGTKFGDSIRVH